MKTKTCIIISNILVFLVVMAATMGYFLSKEVLDNIGLIALLVMLVSILSGFVVAVYTKITHHRIMDPLSSGLEDEDQK